MDDIVGYVFIFSILVPTGFFLVWCLDRWANHQEQLGKRHWWAAPLVLLVLFGSFGIALYFNLQGNDWQQVLTSVFAGNFMAYALISYAVPLVRHLQGVLSRWRGHQ